MADANEPAAADMKPAFDHAKPGFSAAGLSQVQLSETVAMHLREQIISGRLKQGAFMRIDAIAKTLGVSTTPVREGLLLLQSESFVRLIPRRGFVVNSLSKQDLLDLFWAQAIIGGELAARAATRMSRAEIDRLEAIQDEHRDAFVAKNPQATQHGYQFHRAINLAAESPRLALVIGSLTRQVPNQFYATLEGQLDDALEYHPLILKALRAGDAEGARTLMHQHIYSGGRHLIAQLERQGMWATQDR